MKRERVCILYTGGKDSHLALCRTLMFKKFYDIKALVAVIPEDEFSYMFHKPKEEILMKHSEILDIPIEIEYSNKGKEEELEDLKNLLRKVKSRYKVDCVISGAIQSTYQSERINKIANELRLKVYSPLWLNGKKLIEDYKLFNIEAIFYKVSAYPLSEELLGKNYLDYIDLLKKYNINIFGEGGEFETLVLSSNLMREKIHIKNFEKIKLGSYCFLMAIDKFETRKRELKKVNYKIKLKYNKKVLIVDLNENPLGFFEFTYPLWRIFRGKIILASNFFKLLEENPRVINQYKLIVLSGVPLAEFSYEKFYKELELLENISSKIVGICAGAQIIAKFLGIEFAKNLIIGLKEINFKNEKVKAYFLTNYLFIENENIETLGKYGEFVVSFKKGNFLGFAFHPEYNFLTFKQNLFKW